MKIDFTDHSAEVLEKCGLVAEGYAKKLQKPDHGDFEKQHNSCHWRKKPCHIQVQS